MVQLTRTHYGNLNLDLESKNFHCQQKKKKVKISIFFVSFLVFNNPDYTAVNTYNLILH